MSKQHTSSQTKNSVANKKAVSKPEKGASRTESEEAVAVGDQDSHPTVTINGQQYSLESLGEKGREQLQNLRVTDQELQRLQDLLAITKTARNTYARALTEITKTATPVGEFA